MLYIRCNCWFRDRSFIPELQMHLEYFCPVLVDVGDKSNVGKTLFSYHYYALFKTVVGNWLTS